jgi:hypothetical protein
MKTIIVKSIIDVEINVVDFVNYLMDIQILITIQVPIEQISRYDFIMILFRIKNVMYLFLIKMIIKQWSLKMNGNVENIKQVNHVNVKVEHIFI